MRVRKEVLKLHSKASDIFKKRKLAGKYQDVPGEIVAKYTQALKHCIPFRFGFYSLDRCVFTCECPCHVRMGGWAKQYGLDSHLPTCVIKKCSPIAILKHMKEFSKKCFYHAIGYNFLLDLYCGAKGYIRPAEVRPPPKTPDPWEKKAPSTSDPWQNK